MVSLNPLQWDWNTWILFLVAVGILFYLYKTGWLNRLWNSLFGGIKEYNLYSPLIAWKKVEQQIKINYGITEINPQIIAMDDGYWIIGKNLSAINIKAEEGKPVKVRAYLNNIIWYDKLQNIMYNLRQSQSYQHPLSKEERILATLPPSKAEEMQMRMVEREMRPREEPYAKMRYSPARKPYPESEFGYGG